MNIFILEDDDTRINLFMEALKGHTITIAKDVDDAKVRYLRDERTFDLLLLDHDLGNLAMVDGPEGTGLEFARWLITRESAAPQTIVHSWNPDGGAKMLWTLSDAGWPTLQVPFGPYLLDMMRVL